jgi:hypothetical protein
MDAANRRMAAEISVFMVVGGAFTLGSDLGTF